MSRCLCLITITALFVGAGCGETSSTEPDDMGIIVVFDQDMQVDQSMDMVEDLQQPDMVDMMYLPDMTDMPDMEIDQGPPPLSFAQDVFPIFQGNGCSNGPFGGCHGLANPPANLALQEATVAYMQLVDVDATTGPGKRVVPGDASASYLMTFANQSLFGVNPITRAQINIIGQWINEGAAP